MSLPFFSSMVPFGYQRDVLHLLHTYDYSKETPEILLSGSVGSAKSVLLAHHAISHCLRNKGARVAISRQSLPDLRLTIYAEIIEHLSRDFVEGVHFVKRDNTCQVRFSNGSEIIAVSFGDRRYDKVRSLKLSGLIIEEGTDFDSSFYEDGGGFKMFKARLRRIFNVKENFLIVATNPSSEDHFLYKYFIQGHKDYSSRHVYYSITTDNPYLDPVYIDQLKQDYSPLEAERYLRGKWISLKGKGVYAAYDPDINFIDDDYKIDINLPIRISFDFNIAASKPMSCVLFQYDPQTDQVHYYDEAVIEGSYTEDILDDVFMRELLNHHTVIVHGDATGRARTPASKLANYDIIRHYLEQRRVNYEIQVPKANPPVRERHRIMNAYCKNDAGKYRLFVYKKCQTANLGMRTTQLKKGASYIEDDSKREQHITTAMGYGLFMSVQKVKRKSRTIKL